MTNGGGCVTLTTGAPASGAVFYMSRERIQVILAAEVGADGLPCTADDTPATVTPPQTTLVTTGTATSRVIDPQNVDGAPALTAEASGSLFDCDNMLSGNLSGATTARAGSALHALLGLDQVLESTFICE